MRHGFAYRLGPFEHRPAAGQDLPTDSVLARARLGRLRLRVREGPLRTGMVHAPSWEFTEGYMEVRARFPGPEGAHGAAWLQSPTAYASADDHEVDVVEHFGRPRVHHAIWRGPSWEDPEQAFHAATALDPAEWHVYGVDCRASGYVWTVDGREVARSSIPSLRPKIPVLSILSDRWERGPDGALPAPAHDYLAVFDWVRVDP